MDEEQLRQAMREMGSKGGKRRLDTMTKEERKEIARNAGLKSAEAKAARKKLEADKRKTSKKKPTKKAVRPKKGTKP